MILQLSSMGLPQNAFSFMNCTMQSDKYICVKDTTGAQNVAVIVDVANPGNPTKFPVTADSIIIHPTQKILSLRGNGPSSMSLPWIRFLQKGTTAGQTLQVYNIDEKIKLKEHNMSEPIVFWKWISNNTLAMVTEKSVYHWSLEGSFVFFLSKPYFFRLLNLSLSQETTLPRRSLTVLPIFLALKSSTMPATSLKSGCCWLVFPWSTTVLWVLCRCTRLRRVFLNQLRVTAVRSHVSPSLVNLLLPPCSPLPTRPKVVLR